MTDYKLVPAEPTPEMEQAGGAVYWENIEDVCGIYRAMVAAAPAVQGEPAVIPQISGVGRDTSHPRAVILYLRSEPTDDDIRTIQDALRKGCVQPAEQKPNLSLHLFAKRMDEELEKHDIQGFEPVLLAVAEEVLGYERPAEQQYTPHPDEDYTPEERGYPELEPAEQHPDDAAVDRFAAAMKAKLAKKREDGRGGWQGATAEYLSQLLREHVTKGDPVDIGNLAMMLHQNGQGAEQQPAPDVADYEQVLDDHRRLTRELDVLLNGEEGAAQQASMADLVAQLRTVVRNT